jgi:hypothetical protein
MAEELENKVVSTFAFRSKETYRRETGQFESKSDLARC